MYVRFSLVGLLVCSILPSSGQSVRNIPEPSAGNSYTVLYTGRLFGYFRFPAVQKLSENSCLALAGDGIFPSNAAREAQAFQTQMDQGLKAAKGTVIRVAVGDNFAPYVLSRDFVDDRDLAKVKISSKANFEYDIEQKKWVDSPDLDGKGYERYLAGEGRVQADNVACFLMAMQFDAIVPGMHDFYFGPERPRELARLMMQPKMPNYHAVRMLGSNLYLVTKYLDPNKPAGPDASNTDKKATENAKPSKKQADRIRDNFSAKGVLPKTPLPWMRAIRIKGALAIEWKDRAAHQMDEDVDEVFQHTDFDKTTFDDFLKGTSDSIDISGTDAAHPRIRNQFKVTKKVRSVELECQNPKAPEERNLNTCWPTQVMALTPKARIGTDLLYWLSDDAELLQPNAHYALVLKEPGAAKETQCDIKADPKTHCETFNTAFPYFEYPYTPRRLDGTEHPWALKEAASISGNSVAIFGVVDPDLGQYIGQLNRTWLDVNVNGNTRFVDNKYETDLKMSDPAEAVAQALEFCLSDSKCKHSRKILLAEMPAEKVYSMLSELHAIAPIDAFDVVVAQADPDRPTGESLLRRTREKADLATQLPGTPILVPGSHFASDDPYNLHVRLQRAVITNDVPTCDTKSKQCPPPVQVVENTVLDSEPPVQLNPFKDMSDFLQNKLGLNMCRDFCFTHKLAPIFKRLDTKPPDPSPRSWKSAMEKVGVALMQEACQSDVAVLQHRDVFVAPEMIPFLTKQIDQRLAPALIDGMFWKGDAIECLDVPGQSINGLIKRSAQLKQQQESGLVTDLTSNWDLVTAGADDKQTDDAHRVINGQYVDPKKLYKLATTDFIAGGSTGYTTLEGAQPLPNPKWSKLRLRDLGLNMRDEISHGSIDRKNMFQASEYLDELQRPGPPPKPDATFSGWLKGLTSFDEFKPIRADPFEQQAQEKPRWSLMLYRADLSYAVSAHNGSESSLSQRFPGVGFVDLSSADSSSFAADYSVRVQHDSKNWEFYGESDFNYSYKKLRGKNGLYTRSEPADYWYQEAGFAWRLDPRHQSSSAWKLLIPGAFRNQVPPLVQISPITTTVSSSSKSTANGQFVRQEATWYPAFRPGIRWDYAYPKPSGSQEQAVAQDQSGSSGVGKSAGSSTNGASPSSGILASYFEFGYQVGQLTHSPNGYQFSNGGTCYVQNLVPCLTAIGSLPQASSINLMTVISGRSHFQHGLYLDFRLDVPLPGISRLEYVTENRGDFFFGASGDASVDTRFFDDLRQSLRVPLTRRLSIAPTLELIIYQDKILENYYRSYSTFVSLNYTLDWHWMLNFRRALDYANPVPALPTLPSR